MAMATSISSPPRSTTTPPVVSLDWAWYGTRTLYDKRLMFDVVIVPDFSGKRARAFEARTLLFLASWIEFAGRARGFPLHVACIGEPPASVRWLVDRCGALISVHEPVGDGLRGSANKLRGLEVDARTDR